MVCTVIVLTTLSLSSSSVTIIFDYDTGIGVVMGDKRRCWHLTFRCLSFIFRDEQLGRRNVEVGFEKPLDFTEYIRLVCCGSFNTETYGKMIYHLQSGFSPASIANQVASTVGSKVFLFTNEFEVAAVEPLPMCWVIQMPLVLRFRFQRHLLDEEIFARCNARNTSLEGTNDHAIAFDAVSPAVLETFAKIELSTPFFMMSEKLMGFKFNAFERYFAADKFIKLANHNLEYARACHTLLELLIRVIPHWNQTKFVPRLLLMLLPLLPSTKNKHMYRTLLHVVFQLLRIASAAQIREVFEATMRNPNSREYTAVQNIVIARAMVTALADAAIAERRCPDDDWFTVVFGQLQLCCPHSWSPAVLKHFPTEIARFYVEQPVQVEALTAEAVSEFASKSSFSQLFAVGTEFVAFQWPLHLQKLLDDKCHVFPALVFKMISQPFPPRINDVVRCITPHEMLERTVEIIDYISTLCNQITRAQQEQYIPHFVRVIKSLIWEFQLLRLEDIITALVRFCVVCLLLLVDGVYLRFLVYHPSVPLETVCGWIIL